MASLSNSISDALAGTLQGQWETFVTANIESLDERLRIPTFFSQPEEVHSAQYPAVGIFEDGSTVVMQTCRGYDIGGNLHAGWVESQYRFDLQVYVKGRKAHDTQRRMNDYRDTIKAILEDCFDLGGISVTIAVKTDEPSMEWPLASAVTRIGVVRVAVDAFSLQGSTSLLPSG